MQKARLAVFIFFLTLFASNILFASPANWMSQIPDDRILNQLIIPGTHDSGTYGIQPQSKFSLSPDDPLPLWVEEISNILPYSILRPIVAGWAKTQPNSILTQLNNGVRYLDFRVCYFQSHFYLCHTLIGIRLKIALQQIQTFVKKNPTEIIFLDINHVCNVDTPEEATQLTLLIQHYLENEAIPATYHVTDSIGSIRASHRHVIIFMDAQQSIANLFWSQHTITSLWPNASDITKLKSILDLVMALRSKVYDSADNFFVLQVIQTADTDEVIDGILNPNAAPSTLAQFEASLNLVLSQWINEYIAEYGQKPMNIVMQDWFTQQNTLLPIAIQYDTEDMITHQAMRMHASSERTVALKNWFLTQQSIVPTQ